MKLKVIKSDCTVEDYLHTKVIGTINNALGLVDQANVFVSEQFAEVITYHLHNDIKAKTITSDEIHLLILSVLDATGYENAAKALSEKHLQRKLARKRIEVYDDLGDEQTLRWSKSVIVEGLIAKEGISRQLARTIASMVEEKILLLNMTKIDKTLIRHLAATDLKVMTEAQKHLQMSG